MAETHQDEPAPRDEMRIDVELVRQLAAVLDETQLTEIEVEDGERRVRVARAVTVAAPPPASYAPPVAAPAPAAPAPSAPLLADPAAPAAGAVKSPMVGTVYLSPEPGAAPFVATGQKVAAGDTLLIIEAMKVMNPITAPKAGTVVKIFVQNAQPIEFGEALVIVE